MFHDSCGLMIEWINSSQGLLGCVCLFDHHSLHSITFRAKDEWAFSSFFISMDSNAVQDTLTSSQVASVFNVSFESFHSGETPNTATDVRKFFPPESAELLNTPTGADVQGITKANRIFFPDDSGKKASVSQNGPNLHTAETLLDTKSMKVESSSVQGTSLYLLSYFQLFSHYGLR